MTAGVERALEAIDTEQLVRDAAELVSIPSLTGDEKPVLERLERMARRLGLRTRMWEEDPATLLAQADSPGAEAARKELWLLTATLAGKGPRRLALNGHLDVVHPGELPWRHGPWSGAVVDGAIHGRGSVDMKGAVVAALHALGAIRAAGTTPPWEVVLQAVPSEEDGGLGSFAALQRDDAFDACLIVEPTELDVVCANAGALTFLGTVPGRSAHAAYRLEGHSAIDRYVRIHAALAALEDELNGQVEHPLMSQLALPYPILVGRLEAGHWSSQVPDRLIFEGRVGVPVGASPESMRELVEERVREATDDGEAPVELAWTGGQFAPGETDPNHSFVGAVRQAVSAERGEEAVLRGTPAGTDLRLYAARGIPTVLCGPRGVERAHAVDEWVAVDDLVTVARTVVRVALAGHPLEYEAARARGAGQVTVGR